MNKWIIVVASLLVITGLVIGLYFALRSKSSSCKPQCNKNTCGSDGCGGKCSCDSGFTCTDGQCKPCTPDCTNKQCGDSDGCNGFCNSCPDGQVCLQNKCQVPTELSSWDGWATTTMDSETPIWPDTGTDKPNFDLAKIFNNHGKGNKIGSITINGETTDVIGSMGVAIPWAIFSHIFKWKTRDEFVNTVIDSCAGKNDVPCCIIIQPIQKFPTEIKPVGPKQANSQFDMINNLCTGDNCTDINDPSIVATYDNGKKFPAYFLVPFQGCGGNCSTTVSDCFNGCTDVQKVVQNFNYFTSCDDPKPTAPPSCLPVKWMSDNQWVMNQDIENKFYDNKNAWFTISEQTGYGRKAADVLSSSPNKGKLNYCSGKNMHFDVQPYISKEGSNLQDNIFWCQLLQNCAGDPNNSIHLPASEKGAIGDGGMGNTMVRYILVPGDIFGAFDINAYNVATSTPNPPSCGGSSGGGDSLCGPSSTGSWDDVVKQACSKPTPCSDASDCAKAGFSQCYSGITCPK